MPALDKLSIDTPEQVALDFSIATIGSRFLALSIDTLIQAAGTLILVVIAVALKLTTDGWTAVQPWVAAALFFLWYLLYNAYFAAFEAAWNGQTPGKRIIGLRVISVTGRPISPFEAILRNVLRIADQLPGTYAVGIIALFVTDRSQRLGDLAAATVVVHERGVTTSHAAPTFSPDPTPAYRGATRLTPEEIGVIDMFFRRRHELGEYSRLQMARRIASRMRSRLEIAPGTDDEDLLEELMAEYRSSGRYR